jgi:hypothetical protein
MTSARILPLLCAALLLTCGAARADDPMSLARAANGFYGVYATFHPSDGIPNAKDRAKYAPFLSPALEHLLAQAAIAEAHFDKANKNSPPLIEGDLFTSNFEGASTYLVGACAGDAKAQHCCVRLTYDDHKDKPVAWNDTIYLVVTPSGWRVDDIGYGANGDFGNKGKLTDTLHGVIADAGY